MDKEDFRNRFRDTVDDAENIVITSHKGPDDDSVGSVLAMKFLLEDMGHDCNAVYESNASDRWESFEGFDDLYFVNDIRKYVEKADVLIVLDANHIDRVIEEYEEVDVTGEVICIDHHERVEGSFEGYIDKERASTCDMLYELFFRNRSMDDAIGEALLLGILGDTGNFRYISPDNTEVMVYASEIIEKCRIHVEEFKNRYNVTEIESFELYRKIIENSEIYDLDGVPRFICTYLDEEDVDGYDDTFVSNASHMFVGFTKGLEDVGWNFALSQRSNDLIAVSFRSIPGSVNVQKLAEGLGVGGGHENAAGGRFEDVSAQEALSQILEYVKEEGVELQET